MERNTHKKNVYMALAGNPNSGKTTVFNALTGARQHVGNYPGVTVERKEGIMENQGHEARVIDLPGTYSLSAYSPDERVARRVLIEEKPDVVVHIVDAGNLERNLYLSVQLIAMRVPLVLAFNMMDEVQKKGMDIDLDQLSKLLGVPIVPTVGFRGQGIEELKDKAIEMAQKRECPRVDIHFGGDLDRAVAMIFEAVEHSNLAARYDARWVSIKLLEEDAEVMEWARRAGDMEALDRAARARDWIRGIFNEEPEILLADARYGWVHGAVAETVKLAAVDRRTLTDQVDTVLANRVLGLPIFLFLMWLTFEVTFRLGDPLAGLVERVFSWSGARSSALMPGGMLESLLVDGVIAGVGGVLVFLPNIMLLFIMVSLMEDSGYMARAAFIVDRVMHLVGLHGKSFIPLFIGFGCNVPAIMGARILENQRDRITTIMVAPFISCSARLPVYVLLASAFFSPRYAGRVIFSMYILGILVAMVMAKILRTYVVKGEPTPFVMELPPYRMPTAKSVLMHMWSRAWMYVKKAGTIILSFSIIIWALSNFPREVAFSPELDRAIQDSGSVEDLPRELEFEVHKERLEKSFAGRIGHLIAPALEPIGLGNWKVGISLFAGFVAKEIVVSTMGTLYSLGEADQESPDLREAIKTDPFYSPLRAYALMVFILLYLPCLATVVVAYRELRSWRWAALMVMMTTGVAYIVSGTVWWIGSFLGLA